MVSHEMVYFCQLKKKTALLLALALGSFGAHRFYLREYGRGAAYLLFCWTMIPCLLSLIDAFFLLQMPDEEFYELYNESLRLAA